MYYHSKKLLSIIANASFILSALPARADTYRAGEYTINLEIDAKNGRTYQGCDRQKNCIFLTHGTAWRSQGDRGISWENRGYIYSVSWREGTNQPMYLKIFNPQNHLILNRVMLRKK
jgi:hypothetical protein